ncbi:MAG TPA: hypothetical protein V6C97_32635 [Oculatellaceae cyanobacterium]
MTMDDTNAKKTAQEINAHDGTQRFQAFNTLASVSKEDFKQAIQAVDKSIDKNALGLQGFHLDHVDIIDVKADPSKGIPTDQHVPYFSFKDDKGNEADMTMLGGIYDPAQKKQLRAPDAAPPQQADSTATPVTTDTTTGAPKPDATAATTTDSTATATPTTDSTGKQLDAAAAADRAKVQQLMQAQADQMSQSSPVQRKEGYWQVLHRMFPNMSTDDLNKKAHEIKQLNGNRNVLKVGEQLKLMSDDDKNKAVQQQLAQYDQLSPEDKAKVVAQAKAQFPDATTPDATTPAKTTPDATTPAKTTPDATTPAKTTPDATTPDATTPAKTTPDATTPAKTTPDATTPDATANPLLQASVDATSASLKPQAISKDSNIDSNSYQTNLAYNPLAPLGLTEGTPGQDLTWDKRADGTWSRTIQKSPDGKSETITGELDDDARMPGYSHFWKPDGSGLDWNWGRTEFNTQDKFNDQGKLTDRTTTYSRGIDMNFDAGNGANQKIEGVTQVQTSFKPNDSRYYTTVTDGSGKVWNFVSQSDGKVLSMDKPAEQDQ